MLKNKLLISLLLFNTIAGGFLVLVNFWADSQALEETFVTIAIIFALLYIIGNTLIVMRLSIKPGSTETPVPNRDQSPIQVLPDQQNLG